MTYTYRAKDNPNGKNVNKQEYQTMKNCRDITIKPADKGSVVISTDIAVLIEEGHRQLSNTKFYEPTSGDLSGEVIYRINLYVHDMYQRRQIT